MSQGSVSTLNLYPIDYPFETLNFRMVSTPPKTIIDPDFQRKYKWDKEGWGRASKFIESCLMRIPLPSCYFAETEDGRHLVIDGVQRLTTIAKFFNDEFALEGLSVFKELEGKRFSELNGFKAELEATTIRCIVLRKENPKKLIREIFARLNKGAVELSDQEIRHAIYPGSLDTLLSELAAVPEIARFGMGSASERTKDSRESEEQVLRFFAFIDDIELREYSDVLSEYLDGYMERKAEIDSSEIDYLREKFLTALNNCAAMFDGKPFVDTEGERQRQGLVYYDLLMPTVGLLEQSVVLDNVDKIKLAYTELCNNQEFQRSLSGGLQKKSSILKRRNLWQGLLEDAIK